MTSSEPAAEGITRVDWDPNIIDTPIPEQLTALTKLAERVW